MGYKKTTPRTVSEEHIIAIGGGHGLEAVLKGMKESVIYLTAIVTAFDDGGSTRLIKEQYGPPSAGDITKAYSALSRLRKQTKIALNHRFTHGDYNGHTTRNGILAAMWEAYNGDVEAVLNETKILYQVRRTHNVYWSSTENAILHTNIVNSRGERKILIGERKLDELQEEAKTNPEWRIESVHLEPVPRAYEPAVGAIRRADMVVLAPGTLYGSIIPNLLIPEIRDAVNESERLVYVCNLVTEPGHTDDCRVADHIQILHNYGVYPNIVIVNTEEFSEKIRKRYKTQHKGQVKVDGGRLSDMGIRIIEASLVQESEAEPGAIHDPEKTFDALFQALYLPIDEIERIKA